MSDPNILSFGSDQADRSIDELMDYIRNIRPDVVEPAGKRALNRLGNEMAELVHVTGPISARHRGPGKNGKQKWRSEFKHAVDTIKPGRVHRDKDTGELVVIVGPARSDNAPSFYLKFWEYGTKEDPGGRPFLRPARRIIKDQRAVPVMVEEINTQLKKGGGAR